MRPTRQIALVKAFLRSDASHARPSLPLCLHRAWRTFLSPLLSPFVVATFDPALSLAVARSANRPGRKGLSATVKNLPQITRILAALLATDLVPPISPTSPQWGSHDQKSACAKWRRETASRPQNLKIPLQRDVSGLFREGPSTLLRREAAKRPQNLKIPLQRDASGLFREGPSTLLRRRAARRPQSLKIPL